MLGRLLESCDRVGMMCYTSREDWREGRGSAMSDMTSGRTLDLCIIDRVS